MRCAYDAGDDDTERAALEALVAHTGKTEYWNNLLKMSERGQGMRDHDTLDVYRLKLLTGTIAGKDEYTTLAQLALQLQFPAEAQAVIEKAQAAKLLTDDRSNKLLALGQDPGRCGYRQYGQESGRRQAAPKGDALVKIGEDQWGQGKGKDAVTTIKAGIAKVLDDKNNAQIRLGMALISAGQKADAQKALDAVKPANRQRQVGDGRPSLVALRAPLRRFSRDIETAAPTGRPFCFAASVAARYNGRSGGPHVEF